MRKNTYDDPEFFSRYSAMPRSVDGLEAAGEWHALRSLLPPAKGLRIVDLGCGFGWHCRYLADQGAQEVIGVDVSEKMLAVAREKNASPVISYVRSSIEDFAVPAHSVDMVISSLAFHYVESFERICSSVKTMLVPNGKFVFSVEHPIFTAYGSQDWYYDEQGRKLHWPVDRYFTEGKRDAVFLGSEIVKFHKTLTTYVYTLLRAGFAITDLIEPTPEARLLDSVPGMDDELRRPMMLLIAAELR